MGIDVVDAPDRILPFLNDEMKIQVDFHESKPIVIRIPERAMY